MKIITIIGFGRSGMDLLQSLFDGHEQISQFPGYVNFASFYKKINNSNNASFIADTFIHNYQGFFNSKFNKFEKHHKLGAKKNESYRISKVLFKRYLKKILSEYSKKNILAKLHLAYSMANGEDINKKKIILINVHNINNYTFYKDIDFEIFCTIRNPFNSLGSAINNWLNYKNGKYTSPWFLYFHIDRIFNLLDELQVRFNLAYVFIAHDLSVVRHISHEVAVMYMGRIIEQVSTDKLYETPLHPYTKALISAVPVPDPRIERTRQRILLEGDLPSPLDLPVGCSFASRCWKSTELCSAVPALIAHEDHFVACHHPEKS